jgi:hypothetical protein
MAMLGAGLGAEPGEDRTGRIASLDGAARVPERAVDAHGTVPRAAAGTATTAGPLYRGDDRGAPLAARGHANAPRAEPIAGTEMKRGHQQ